MLSQVTDTHLYISYNSIFFFRLMDSFLVLKHVLAEHAETTVSPGIIAGIAIGSSFLVIVLIVVAMYAIRQKKRAEKAIGLSKPFGKYYPLNHSNQELKEKVKEKSKTVQEKHLKEIVHLFFCPPSLLGSEWQR